MKPVKKMMSLPWMVMLAYFLSASSGGAVTFKELIDEACAPTHFPLLPPCGKSITIEELNSRLRYKLEMMKIENQEWKDAITSWEKSLGLLYVEPTQTIWDSNKKIALMLSTDLIREQLSEAIDAQGAAFLADANGDVEMVRKHILWYLIGNGWDKERVVELERSKNEINKKHLFDVQLPHR